MDNEYRPSRLFIIEAPSPMDLLQDRSEADALKSICRLIGHEVAVLPVHSLSELGTACSFIANIASLHDSSQRPNVPLFIHLAAHGDKDGLGIGHEVIEWKSLFNVLKPIFSKLEHYDGPVILVISACGAAYQTLTSQIQSMQNKNGEFNPPAFLFVHSGDFPTFQSAVVSWTVFYHHLPGLNLDDRGQVQEALRKVKEAGAATIKYYRWDKTKTKYISYSPEKE
jgi:hypothetical protein